jgi:UDP-N-acetylglucosamine--N-acetylmuramyl-(pentapeptide) pyrophosphoryl-undecaprenol N-acetylglucosamine transferase
LALSWVIAGGGTGGHVTPALALGEAARAVGDRVLFVGSQRGLEARLVPEAGFELVALPSQQVMGRSIVGRMRGGLNLLGQVGAARAALRRAQADCVVSVGGYAAMPAVLAAISTRTPLFLVEPNAIPGRVNRFSARFASRVFVGFEAARTRLAKNGDDPRIERLGIPVRTALIDAFSKVDARQPEVPPLRLLVFGGSQGARQINEAVMRLLPRLAELPIEIFHQAGELDFDAVRKAYEDFARPAEVVRFEPDMPTRYGWADLALCRAGALTIAELALAGLPALLVPLPSAADDHQSANARALADAGAAVALDPRPLDDDALFETLKSLCHDGVRLARMSKAARGEARPTAAADIVSRCRSLLARAGAGGRRR